MARPPRSHARLAPRQICLVDPDCRVIGMHLYEGEFKIIPMDASGLLDKEAVSIRLDELKASTLAARSSKMGAPPDCFTHTLIRSWTWHSCTGWHRRPSPYCTR